MVIRGGPGRGRGLRAVSLGICDYFISTRKRPLDYSVGLLYIMMLINMVDFQSSNVDGHVVNDILICYVPCFLPHYLI